MQRTEDRTDQSKNQCDDSADATAGADGESADDYTDKPDQSFNIGPGSPFGHTHLRRLRATGCEKSTRGANADQSIKNTRPFHCSKLPDKYYVVVGYDVVLDKIDLTCWSVR